MQSPYGSVVLFTSETEGTIIHAGESNDALGEHSNDWIPATDSHWIRFTGTLNLSNS